MIVALIAYLLFQLGICLVASRWISTEADYLLAGRRLGLWPSSLSLFATWFGAEVVIASTGAIAAVGLSGGRADPFGYTLCLLAMGLLIAKAFRAQQYVTVGDFFKQQFGRPSEVLACVLLILTSLIWTAAQIQAFGWILSSITPLEMTQTLPIALLIVMAYTWIGGLLGDVVTDVIQGGLLMIGLVVLLGVLLIKSGGVAPALASVPSNHWSFLAPETSGESWLGQMNVWMIAIFGSLVAPEALTRTLAAKSPQTARNACFLGGGLYLLMGCVVVAIALVGAPLVANINNLASTDEFLPQLIHQTLPPWASALLLGALVSAILSTIDSTLLSIAGLASHNLLLPIISKKLTPINEKTKVLLARGVVVASGLLAYWIATGSRGIYALVELASSFGSAGFLVCVLGNLHGRGISPRWAFGILVAGAAQTLVYELWWQLDGAFIWNLVGCLGLYALGYWAGHYSPAAKRRYANVAG